MPNYSNDKCPVCGLNFTENDDIVVCPHCGTPHHRECYKSNGGCANSQLHDEGFTFVPTAPPCESSESESKNEESKNEETENNAQAEFDPNKVFGSVLGHTISDGDNIDGVPVGDLKKFVGNGWMYYIPLFFAKVKNLRVFRINFSALLGSYTWLFARKFYLLGCLSALLTSASYFYVYFYIAYLNNAGIDVTKSLTSIFQSTDSFVVSGYYIYTIVSYIPFIISLLTGIFANRLYMKKCVKKVKKINSTSASAEQFNERLSKKGGLNLPLLFISLALVASFYILDARGIIESLMLRLVKLI